MSDAQAHDGPSAAAGPDSASPRTGPPTWPSDSDGWSTGTVAPRSPGDPPHDGPATGHPPAPPAAPPPYGWGGPGDAGRGGAAPNRAGWSGSGAAPRNTLGTVALVLGILGLLTFWTTLPGLVLGVAAIVLGAISRARARRGEASNGSVALAGLVTGIVACVLAVALLAVAIGYVVTHKDTFNRYADCTRQASSTTERDACTQQLYDRLFR